MTRYVNIVGVDQIGPDAGEGDLEAFCSAATDWLSEHEGDGGLSITVRAPDRGEVTGTYRVRGGIPSGPEVRRYLDVSDDEDPARRVVELLEQVWELYCKGELPGVAL